MYQALYRKWRPKTFDDVVGQEHISETLKNQIVSGRLSHAYLFVGTRGTGKTTCAKILARAVNCTQAENGNPCNKCPSCRGIENGSIMDVLELDAASNNGVENVRALREEAVFTPVDVRRRVYIIDEVHMLSTSAFNALLKILEEPPEHLIFILATTEINKVPATILSRCQRFTFKRILPVKIAERLLYVAGREGLSLTNEAAKTLARMSDGSMRDALSLLDQCASSDVIDNQRVLSAIGLAENDEIARILTAVAGYELSGALEVLDKLYMSGKIISSVIESLMNLVRDLLVAALMPGGGSVLLSGGFDQAVLEGFKKCFTTPRLLEIMDILRETMLDISKSGGGKLSAELCLMRLCTRRPAGDLSSVLARLSSLEERLGGSIAFSADKSAEPERSAAPAKSKLNESAIQSQKAAASVKPADVTTSWDPPAAEPAAASDLPPKADPGPVPESRPGDVWNQILTVLQPKIDFPKFACLSDQAQASAQIDGGIVTIKAKNVFTASTINVQPVTDAIKAAASEVVGSPVLVRVIIEDGSASGGNNKVDVLKARFPGFIQVEE